MHPLDWIILAFSLVAIIGYGLYKSRGSRTAQSYMLAGRTMRWWVIGLSIMATQASAITFIGTTGQGYSDGIRFVQFYFGLPIAMVLIAIYIIPFFQRAGVYTAYEYLEARFDAKTRTLASLIFLVQRGLGVGVALYAPSVVLAVIFGWPEEVTILVMGVLVVTYTVIGGIKAVMWTDAQQMLVMFLGIFIAFFSAVFGLPDDISFASALDLAGAAGKLKAVELNFDWNDRYNLWSGVIGGTFLALSYFGCDQSQVQRYLTGKSLTHMRLSLLFNAMVKVPLQFVILLTGAMVFSFFLFEQPPLLFHGAERSAIERSGSAGYSAAASDYEQAFQERREAARAFAGNGSQSNRESFLAADAHVQSARTAAISAVESSRGGAYNDTNYIFLTFVVNHLPVGIVGLILAAVFAAAMSTISAELNSLATATAMDHYGRYIRPKTSEEGLANFGRLATAFWGLYATIFASFAGQLGSLIEAVNLVGSLFYGALLGVFVLALGPWRPSGTGAFVGMLAGLAVVWWTSANTGISFLWYNVIGCTVTVLVGLLFRDKGVPPVAAA